MIVHNAEPCVRNRLALSLAALLLALPGALAAPLEKDDCDKLKLEQGHLEQEGVRANMAKGPEWAKGNLKPEQLEQVRRVIEVDGQLLFRCNGRPLVTLPKDLEEPREDGSEPPPKAKEENAARPTPEQPTPGKAAAVTDKTGPHKAPHQAKAPASAKQAGVAAAGAKAKPKTKADDAYKPPVTDPLADPFANQQPPADKN